MAQSPAPSAAAGPRLHWELRYWLELARLLADRDFVFPRRDGGAPPVLLVPGFLAGDASLSILRDWLRRRGSTTATAGIRLNVDCGERAVRGVEIRLQQLSERCRRPVAVVGQSRGGALARVLAVRNPDLVGGLVMLGSPVLDPLSVGASVLSAVRSMGRLGDLGVPGVFSRQCSDGPCCAEFRGDLTRPLPESVRAIAIYSHSDGIVSWPACLDAYARQVEVSSSHCGMSVNRAVYRVLDQFLEQEMA